MEGWGTPDCPGEPDKAFAPHGIHLSRRGDGRLQLLVVNHGGREAIEVGSFDPWVSVATQEADRETIECQHNRFHTGYLRATYEKV